MRYPHDIRMKYCGFGCGCQNSCGYLRMRSSDTLLISTSVQIHKCTKISEFRKHTFMTFIFFRAEI